MTDPGSAADVEIDVDGDPDVEASPVSQEEAGRLLAQELELDRGDDQVTAAKAEAITSADQLDTYERIGPGDAAFDGWFDIAAYALSLISLLIQRWLPGYEPTAEECADVARYSAECAGKRWGAIQASEINLGLSVARYGVRVSAQGKHGNTQEGNTHEGSAEEGQPEEGQPEEGGAEEEDGRDAGEARPVRWTAGAGG